MPYLIDDGPLTPPAHDVRRGVMREHHLLAGLPGEALQEFDLRSAMRRFVPGVVLRPAASTVYVVKEGRVALRRGELTVAVVGRGALFGDSAFIGESCVGLSVEPVEDTLLCWIGDADLAAVMTLFPELALRLLEIVGRRAGGRVA